MNNKLCVNDILRELSLRCVEDGYPIWPQPRVYRWLDGRCSRDHSMYGLSHWETVHYNAVSHWLGLYTEWSLTMKESPSLAHSRYAPFAICKPLSRLYPESPVLYRFLRYTPGVIILPSSDTSRSDARTFALKVPPIRFFTRLHVNVAFSLKKDEYKSDVNILDNLDKNLPGVYMSSISNRVLQGSNEMKCLIWNKARTKYINLFVYVILSF